MLFLLVVIANFAVLAVDSCLRANLKMSYEVAVRDLLATLAVHFFEQAAAKVLQGIVVGQRWWVLWVWPIKIRAFELLLL